MTESGVCWILLFLVGWVGWLVGAVVTHEGEVYFVKRFTMQRCIGVSVW